MMPPDADPEPEPEHSAAARRARPTIDVSAALHDAGHEVHDLGFEGIPDDGPVVHPEEAAETLADPLDFVNVQLPSD